MKFQTTHSQTSALHDMVVVFVCVEKKHLRYIFPSCIDTKTQSEIKAIGAKEEFEAAVGKTVHLHTMKSIPHVLLVGIGEATSLTMEAWLTVTALIGRESVKRKMHHISIDLSFFSSPFLSPFFLGQGIVVGMRLGTYTFDTYKKKKQNHTIDFVTVIALHAQEKEIQRGIAQGDIISESVRMARDLVNTPASETTPMHLASVARSLARGNGKNLTCSVFGKADMKRLGMGGILGIARGSHEEPACIELVYDGGGTTTIVLVGKGITFDTGGLSLKSQDGMEIMKIDMGGAATVLGVFAGLRSLQLPLRVVGLIPATENMPGGGAIKPGDVVRAYDGTTIEVVNTDAEGRVILADALAYAAAVHHPSVLIDLATLTGACEVALGEEIAGLFSTNASLAHSLRMAGEQSGELLWELPLPKTYEKKLESTVADVRNVTKTRWGGAITAALFLKAFVPDTIPWAHLDIAGPVYAEGDLPLTPVGATGYGVRLILQYLSSISA